MQAIKTEVEQALQPLLGLPMTRARRYGDMVRFHFGQERMIHSRRHGLRVLPEYALHVRCSWRIAGPRRILVASADRFCGAAPGLFDDDEDMGANRCDEGLRRFFEEAARAPLCVRDIWADHLGSFRLELDDNLMFEVFPDDTADDASSEFWRFFQPGRRGPHFTVSHSGIGQ